MADANGVLGFSSDWVTDVGVLSGQASFSVPNGTSNELLASHSLGYRPIATCQYTIDTNGGVWFPTGTYFVNAGTPGRNLANGVRCYVNITTTGLRVYFNNFSGASRDVTVRYWIYQNALDEVV